MVETREGSYKKRLHKNKKLLLVVHESKRTIRVKERFRVDHEPFTIKNFRLLWDALLRARLCMPLPSTSSFFCASIRYLSSSESETSCSTALSLASFHTSTVLESFVQNATKPIVRLKFLHLSSGCCTINQIPFQESSQPYLGPNLLNRTLRRLENGF